MRPTRRTWIAGASGTPALPPAGGSVRVAAVGLKNALDRASAARTWGTGETVRITDAGPDGSAQQIDTAHPTRRGLATFTADSRPPIADPAARMMDPGNPNAAALPPHLCSPGTGASFARQGFAVVGKPGPGR
ncbi:MULTISPECIES: hypothetical protein [Methylobacterium]|uniref:Uncharacterized protein n=1 Tax=Methylobacterium longum TaxID=767694 RepID=A0ABT8AKN8_9HYPH|nr:MULTISPECIES: hypothetical protein [Methylobacterium]MCJ2099896.1 hypothetical protein [Methylobacterium sp. E-046]MDN3570381.1 hypothetical protein [Methylobacterium longum]GJE11380.1 hypothetical protein FOHLNKBM_2423 [Methylobacterium longum]